MLKIDTITSDLPDYESARAEAIARFKILNPTAIIHEILTLQIYYKDYQFSIMYELE